MSVALFIVGILLISSSDYENIKTNLRNTFSELSVQKSNCCIQSSLEDLGKKLETLETKLEEKRKEVEDSKSEVYETTEKIQALNETSKQIKLFYTTLKNDLSSSEEDCSNLYKKIDEYRNSQMKLKKEIQRNIRYYYDLLNAIQNCRFLEKKDTLRALPGGEGFELERLYTAI